MVNIIVNGELLVEDVNGKFSAIEMESLKCRENAYAEIISAGNKFPNIMKDVTYHIDRIERNNKETMQLQNKILSGAHKKYIKKDKTRLNELVESNKSLGIRIQKALSQEQEILDDETNEVNIGAKKVAPGEQYEMKLRRNWITAQFKRFYDAWKEFIIQQVRYRDRTKDLLKQRCKIMNDRATDEEIENMLGEGKDEMFYNSIYAVSRAPKEQKTEIHCRHQEFLELEKSIRQVHDLFKTLADIVSLQGDNIESVECCIQDSPTNIQKSRKEWKGTSCFNYSAISKRSIVLCSLLVVILLIAILGAFNAYMKQNEDLANQSTTMSITASMREGKTTPDFGMMWTPGEPEFEPPPEK